MSKKFWSYLKTDKYNIGLTSKTIYICDKDNNEIIRFKDIDYAYRGIVSPDQELLVVKSTGGKIAVYSLSKLELIKKFHFSKVDSAQDDNFIFSPDGKYLLNIERHITTNNSILSIYNTNDFSLYKRLFEKDDELVLSMVEYNKEFDNYFVLGFLRDVEIKVNRYFIARLVNDKLIDMKFIDEQLSLFINCAKAVEFAGFTEEAYKWLFVFKIVSLDEIKSMDLSLATFWKDN